MRGVVIAAILVSLLQSTACNKAAKEPDRKRAAEQFDQHCRNLSAIASSVIEELQGPRRSDAMKLASSMTVRFCMPPQAHPAQCFESRDPGCMSRGLAEASTKYFRLPSITPSNVKAFIPQPGERDGTYCRKAGILANEMTKLGNLEDVTASQFAAFDFEVCGGGDNRAFRECYLNKDLECLKGAARALDELLYVPMMPK